MSLLEGKKEFLGIGLESQESFPARRYRNIVAAYENLLTQLGAWESPSAFAQSLRRDLAIYRHEQEFHRDHK